MVCARARLCSALGRSRTENNLSLAPAPIAVTTAPRKFPNVVDLLLNSNWTAARIGLFPESFLCARDVHTGEELSIAKMINAPIDGPHGIECDDGCRAPVFTGQQVASTSRSTTTL